MFTGIIEEVGTVTAIQKGSTSSFIEIQADKVLSGTKVGDSIAVNGVCLTATVINGKTFRADVMNETLSRSSLGQLRPGSHVDLERAMAADGRFGGHIVSGHIDGTGTIINVKNDGIAIRYTLSADSNILRYIVEKGSVAIDGISLTVVSVSDHDFTVSVIPHTASVTVLGEKHTGDTVNIENDIIGKYVERLMKPDSENASSKSNITMEFLAEHGF